ncbi:lactococcin 972 family bacteriocin [Bifidobacterium pseudolongum]
MSGNSDSGVMPLAEAFPVEGGTWQYGRNLVKAWSNYYHPTKPHASTVTSGNKRSVSANTRAGYWSYATLNGFYSSANYYYRVL